MRENRRLVGSSEAARQLGVHYSALSRWVREGKITPASVTGGGQTRWDMDDLRRQLKTNAEQAALQPLHAAHTSLLSALERTAEPHQTVELAGKVLATLEQMTDDVKHERSAAIELIRRDESRALAPLADEVDVHVKRRREK